MMFHLMVDTENIIRVSMANVGRGSFLVFYHWKDDLTSEARHIAEGLPCSPWDYYKPFQAKLDIMLLLSCASVRNPLRHWYFSKNSWYFKLVAVKAFMVILQHDPEAFAMLGVVRRLHLELNINGYTKWKHTFQRMRSAFSGITYLSLTLIAPCMRKQRAGNNPSVHHALKGLGNMLHTMAVPSLQRAEVKIEDNYLSNAMHSQWTPEQRTE